MFSFFLTKADVVVHNLLRVTFKMCRERVSRRDDSQSPVSTAFLYQLPFIDIYYFIYEQRDDRLNADWQS
jgi:hypothetical protein